MQTHARLLGQDTQAGLLKRAVGPNCPTVLRISDRHRLSDGGRAVRIVSRAVGRHPLTLEASLRAAHNIQRRHLLRHQLAGQCPARRGWWKKSWMWRR